MEQETGLSQVADGQGFLVAYPQALKQGHGRYAPGWDASGPADPDAGGIDDGLFVSDLLTAIQADYCVDPARIWATGVSNGGSMAGYLGCVLAGRIAAVAPVEGVFFQIPGGCHPARPAAILDVHVRTDPVAPYAGVPARGSPQYFALSIPMWLRAWAGRDRCAPVPRQGTGPGGLTTQAWASCAAGTAVEGDAFASGGHSWFQSIGATAGDRLLLRFFAAHPLGPVQPAWTPGPPLPLPAPAGSGIAIAGTRVFRLPDRGALPFDIAAGPDGSLWFTEFAANKIGRISRTGALAQFQVPTASSGPYQISAGPGGMWFTEYNTTKIGRISPSGAIREFPLPAPSYGGTAITGSRAGPAFAADPAGFIDVASAAGTVTRIKVPTSDGLPFAIARLPDGALWLSELTGFYEFSRHLIRVRPGSAPLDVTLPDPRSDIVALAAGPGGTAPAAERAWWADFGASDIGAVGPDGTVSLFAVGVPDGGLSDITAGPGGAMWFSEQDGTIGRVTPNGHVAVVTLFPPDSDLDGIAAGPGNTIWVTEAGDNAIAEITLGLKPPGA
jgi:virginiamycin B lyase